VGGGGLGGFEGCSGIFVQVVPELERGRGLLTEYMGSERSSICEDFEGELGKSKFLL